MLIFGSVFFPKIYFMENFPTWECIANNFPNKQVLGIFMGILATPPKATPPRNKALLRAY